MKFKFILFVFFTLFFNLSFAQSEKKIEKAIIKTNIYCEHCLQCESCGKKFNTELYKINGLKSYELNQVDMTFTVYFNTKKTNLETIKNKIATLGYDADDIKAEVLAYQNLDNCCKIK